MCRIRLDGTVGCRYREPRRKGEVLNLYTIIGVILLIIVVILLLQVL
jgi:hypothetical protein